MAVRIIGVIMVVFSGVYAGLYVARRNTEKMEFIAQYAIFLTQVRAMISYSGMAVREILEQVHSVPLLDGTIQVVIHQLDNGEAFESAWKSAVEQSLERKAFLPDDLPLLTAFGESFGDLGAQEEADKITGYLNSVEIRLKELKKDTIIRNRLYRTIGIFCGVLAAIVML